MTVRALRYYGGKSPTGNNASGPWIEALLPRRERYIEPFGGMAGVLLSRRPPFGIELLNDRDGRIVHWWRMVRDAPDELARLAAHTPRSRRLLRWAWATVQAWDDPDPAKRALAVHVMLRDGLFSGLGRWPGFATLDNGSTVDRVDVARLADRLRNVALEDMDACDLLDRVVGCRDATIYVDPPYLGSDTSPYGVDDVDMDRLTDLLRRCAGFVAVSGVPGDWDHLGWDCTTSVVKKTAPWRGTGNQRTECVWTNGPVVRAERELWN